MNGNRIPRIGVRVPVGSGKTMLIERVVPILAAKGYKIGIVSNYVVSREDADRMRGNLALEQQLLPQELVIGLATGGRKRGLGIETCDLLVINKIDLAPHVGVDHSVVEREVAVQLEEQSHLFLQITRRGKV